MGMHAQEREPLDPSMRPLVRAIVTTSKTMGKLMDDAASTFSRQGYLDPIELVKRLPWVEAWEIPIREAWEVSMARVMRNAFPHDAPRKVHKEFSILAELPVSRQEWEAIHFLERHGLKMVKDLSAENKKAILEVLDRGIKDGASIPKMVAGIKNSIGLLPKQVRAVQRQSDALREQGKSDAQIAAQERRQSARMLRQRAENIARTETVRALNQGQLVSWNRQVRARELPQTILRKWIPAMSEKTCSVCIELGTMPPKPMGEQFFSPALGRLIMAPPAHPSCRCSMGLV